MSYEKLESIFAPIGNFCLCVFFAFMVNAFLLIVVCDLRTLWGYQKIQGNILDIVLVVSLFGGLLGFGITTQENKVKQLKTELAILKKEG